MPMESNRHRLTDSKERYGDGKAEKFADPTQSRDTTRSSQRSEQRRGILKSDRMNTRDASGQKESAADLASDERYVDARDGPNAERRTNESDLGAQKKPRKKKSGFLCCAGGGEKPDSSRVGSKETDASGHRRGSADAHERGSAGKGSSARG